MRVGLLLEVNSGLGVILLAMTLAPASGGPCMGECSVYCDSGALYYFYESAQECCARAYSLAMCPDGSTAYASSWQPDTCGVSWFCQ